jgi:hypothetical protein
MKAQSTPASIRDGPARHLPSQPNWENSRDSLAGAGGVAPRRTCPPAAARAQGKPAFSWLRSSPHRRPTQRPASQTARRPQPRTAPGPLNQMYGDDTPEPPST